MERVADLDGSAESRRGPPGELHGLISSGRGPAANFFGGGLGPAPIVTSGLDGVASTRTRCSRVNSWGQGRLELVGTKNGGQGQVQLFRGSVQTQICVEMTRLGFELRVEALICLTRLKFEPRVEALSRLTGLRFDPWV